jgi:hypothetical protein
MAPFHPDPFDHVEIDDAQVELRVQYGAEGLPHPVLGQRHYQPPVGGFVVRGYFHYVYR